MAAESLVNPYCIDGSLYVLRSLGAASYGGVILELNPVWVMPAAALFWGASILVAFVSCCLARRFPPGGFWPFGRRLQSLGHLSSGAFG